MDYESQLDRAMENLPDIAGSEDRFEVPSPSVRTEGKSTILENFQELLDVLNRDEDHVMKFLLRELGTAGQVEENGRARFKGDFSEDDFARIIDAYVAEYVLCSECGRPDTHLEKEDRTLMLRCDACGAFRPVKKRKARPQQQKKQIEEGKTYELKITAIGNKGDGIAKKGDYTIFVSGAKEGDIVKARINNISGNLAFADRVE
ncbi:MAG: translation initiation factor IF-2 subunit beta [Halobacteria archaeon]|nr:translation initiation factor IF-2 subunit beta [Halobacteria archaeon]